MPPIAVAAQQDPTPPKPALRPPEKSRRFIHKLRHLSRKQIIIISVVLGLLIAGALIWWFVLRDKPQPPQPVAKQETKKEEPPAPTTVASRLTGLQVAPELNNLPTTAIMIENSPDARPQAGLYQAGVVYEAIAEGGITRFLALYLEARPDYIGPVRSVRPYYLDWLVPYDAAVVHAGGSGPALAEIRNQKIKDIEHGQNAAYFQRVSTRYAPHNLYTNRVRLLELHSAKGYTSSTFEGFVRKADKPIATPNARAIDFSISSPLYNPHFDYVPTTNSYVRSMAGKPHMDEREGKQINPKVVVALVMTHRYAGIYSVYGTLGTGKAYFFQDGTVTEGIWQKADRKSQFRFGDVNGAPLGLNAGQTWISIVSTPNAVTFKP